MKIKTLNPFKHEFGFTLVEAVVAITIIGIIGVIMSDILSRAFGNTQKTNLISNVQQNGQTALASFEDTIRYSEFVCVGGNLPNDQGAAEPNLLIEYFNPVLVVFKDGKYIRIRIEPETGNKNGFVAEDFPINPDNSSARALCTAPLQLQNSRTITNESMLSVKRGSITLLSNPVNGQTVGTSRVSITIQFAIGPDYRAPINAENQIGQNNEILFQSTAQFR